MEELSLRQMFPVGQIRLPYSTEDIEAFAPEVFELARRYAEETLAGQTDFDLELYDAVEAILNDANLDKVIKYVSPVHPRTEEAIKLLRKAHSRFKTLKNLDR